MFRKGSLIGDEDSFAGWDNFLGNKTDQDGKSVRMKYTTTVKWTSKTGRLFVISAHELVKRLKEKPNSWDVFSANALGKEIKVLKKVCAKEKFKLKFDKLVEKLNLHADTNLIESYLSLESKSKIGLNPPKKLIATILKWIKDPLKGAKKRESVQSDCYNPETKEKHFNYENLKDHNRSIIQVKVRKNTIDDFEVEKFKKKQKSEKLM